MSSRSKKVEKQVESVKKFAISSQDNSVEFIHSGSTMLNLAASGKGKDGGWARGRIANIVGDNSTGKSALALELAAQFFYFIEKAPSKIYPPIKNKSVVYNNVEGVMDFPLAAMYKDRFVQGVEWIRTGTVEAFGFDYVNRVRALKPGDSLLYVLDTWDALDSEAGAKRFEKSLEDNKIEGTFGLEKQKYASSFFAHLCDVSQGKDATLIIISQIRDKINVMFGKKHYRAGGKALDFYCHQICWLAEVERQTRIFRGQTMVHSLRSKAKFEKNKVAKPYREAEFTILYDYGLDDLNSMINWYWGPKVAKIHFDDVDFDRADFVAYIEQNGLKEEIVEMVTQEWQEIEMEIAPKRMDRFGNETDN